MKNNEDVEKLIERIDNLENSIPNILDTRLMYFFKKQDIINNHHSRIKYYELCHLS